MAWDENSTVKAAEVRNVTARLPLSEYRAFRRLATRQHVTLAELLRQQVRAILEAAGEDYEDDTGDDL